ncbi:hypothetical protein NC653_008191 [Populus alba x Populus x berolinensis]|uniref:Uncharacterized protein n=1 Tax=Populus alba x Populus x berolinensis TaxID=444605 RepID=A0AAD6R739_9ROSI|nr:hypothetical protein NC653_008191 [Populus alba x Populus x berolinensis]
MSGLLIVVVSLRSIVKRLKTSINLHLSNRLPLRKLFYEDRETFLCSSSEANDIDSLEPGTYCVLTPKKEEGSPGSLGTEKRKEAKGAGGGLFQFQEHYYVRSKEGDKCRFYLPCRPDLLRFLSNVNGVGRNLHLF